MQRLQNIEKWVVYSNGEAMSFEARGERRMRLDVNCPQEVLLYLANGNGEQWFLARVIGRDVIEFQTPEGDFSIIVSGGECWAYSIDGEDLSFEIPDAHSLTKIRERRQTNPEIEMMRAIMEANMKSRDAQQKAERDELVRILNQRDEAWKAEIAKLAGSSAGGAGAEQPAPEGTDAGAGAAAGTAGSGGSATK